MSDKKNTSDGDDQPSSTKLQLKLGSLYERIHQLHNEQHNIYPPFNNYEQYRVYCTKRLARLRHCSYKIITPTSSSDENYEGTTGTNNSTTTTIVKSLLLHNSKYSNSIPAIKLPIDSGSDVAVTAIVAVSPTTKLPSKRSKYAYHSRKVVYDNILFLGQDETDETMVIATNDANMDKYYHENVIWNLFYQAERAWAQACAILHQPKQELNHVGTNHQYKKKLSNHRHVQNRFNKAVHWSQLLYNTVRALLVDGKNNFPSTIVFVNECYAYMKWMEGNAALEHKDYILAYRNYSISVRRLYDLQQQQQIDNNNERSDNYHEKWKLHIENVLRPLVRYCQYEMKDLAADVNNIIEGDVLELIDQTSARRSNSSASSSSSITKLRFRNVDVTFDNHTFSQQVTVAYLKLEPVLSSLTTYGHDSSNNDSGDDDESTHLRLMSDLDDLMLLVIKEYKMKYNNANTAVSHPQQQLFITFYSYLKYYKLSIWRQQQEARIRDTVLNSKSSSDSNVDGIGHGNSAIPDMIHLYTTLQQIVISMNELVPTIMVSNGDVVDEDDPYALEAQAHIVRVRAFRCYYMAQYYEMTALFYEDEPNMSGISSSNSHMLLQQEKNMMAARLLLQHAQLLTKRAIEEMSACEGDATLLLSSQLINQYLNELEQLNIHIKAMFCRVDATNYLLQQQSKSVDGDTKSTTTLASSTSFPLHPNRPLWMSYKEEVVDEEEEKDGDATTMSMLVDDPPLPIPLPCKGVFFDIAIQCIDEIVHEEVVQILANHCCSTTMDQSTTGTTITSGNNDQPAEVSSLFANNSFVRWLSSSNTGK